MREKVNFAAHAQIKSTIGKDLINDDSIAVVELVKNSIDAQSGIVNITFENLIDNSDDVDIYDPNLSFSSLIIQDDGVGMDYHDITQKWLNIAYSEKKNAKKTYAGSKGVGRFSCDRLGEFLNIYTRKKGGDIFHLHVNWKDFEIDDDITLKVQDVKLDLRIISEEELEQKFKGGLPQGTILEILKLRVDWLTEYKRKTKKGKYNRDKLLALKRSLGKIVSPNLELDSHAQLISLSVPILNGFERFFDEFDKVNGIIENKIFKELNFRTTYITSNISEDGEFITTSIIDKDIEILKIKEKNVDYPDIRQTQIKLYYLNSYAKAYFRRQTGIRSVDYGSVFLFLCGFRVSKLGDSQDDWLGLEMRKSQGRNRYLSGRELIGHVEVNDPNHKIGIVSAREGITKTLTSEQLTARTLENNSSGFFYKTLRRLERYVVDGLDWDAATQNSIDIEKYVNAGNWNEDDEKYKLSHQKKIERICKALGSIVDQDTDKKNILDLYINFDFFATESDNIAIEAQESFNKFVDKHNIDISSLDELKKIKQKLKAEETRAKEAEKKAERAEKKAKQAEKAKKSAEKEKQHYSEAYEEEKKRSLFLKEQESVDKDDLQEFMHQIIMYASDSKSQIKTTINRIKKGKITEVDKLNNFLSKQLENVGKILETSKFATNANFRLDSGKLVDQDLTEFIISYLNDVAPSHQDKIEIIPPKDTAQFIFTFSPIEVGMILDNLISNARKSQNFDNTISFQVSVHDNVFEMIIEDRGRGLAPSIIEPSRIFEKGFSRTNGSGFGLFFCKKHIKEMGGKFFLTQKQPSRGVSFTMRLVK